jgi:hypothetical protein
MYLEDPGNFANLITIQGAHTIDLAIAVAGALSDLSALATAQYPEILAGQKAAHHLITFFSSVDWSKGRCYQSKWPAVVRRRPHFPWKWSERPEPCD